MFIRKFLLIIISAFGSFFFLMEHLDYEKENIDIGVDIQINSIISKKKNIYDDEILFTMYIPSINLQENVYTMNSSFNHVDKNIQILEGSNIDNNFLFLAAHSGTGVANYFNQLVELEKGDMILIDNGVKKLYFVVDEYFYIPKSGYLEYPSDEFCDLLYLITCSLEYLDYQLVVKARLVY